MTQHNISIINNQIQTIQNIPSKEAYTWTSVIDTQAKLTEIKNNALQEIQMTDEDKRYILWVFQYHYDPGEPLWPVECIQDIRFTTCIELLYEGEWYPMGTTKRRIKKTPDRSNRARSIIE